MTCSGCGVELDQTQEQVNSLGSQVLDPSLHGAANTGGICPLCGRSKTSAYARRKRIVIGFLKVLLLVGTAVGIAFYASRTTEPASFMRAAAGRLNGDPAVVQRLAKPMNAASGVEGEVRHEET